MNATYFVGLAAGLLALVGIWELLRRRQIREKYTVLWVVIGVLVLVFSAIPELLRTVSTAIGFEVPANFLFLSALLLLMGMNLHLSWEASRLEGETRRLAEDLAILRAEVENGIAGPNAISRPVQNDPGPATP